MTESEAKKEIEHNVFCNTDNFEMTISKECYKTIINALEKREKIKEIIANANQWSKEDIVVKAQAYCDIEKILRSDKRMSDLISRSKIRDYIKTQINHYGKPFEGTAYELGLKIMRYIDAMDSVYDIDKVVEELEADSSVKLYGSQNSDNYMIPVNRAIEIVKHGCVSDDVCEWRLCDEEANVYDTSCRNPHILIEGTPKENNYEYCPYCGKKIKVVE